jgi:hypothetical protein
MKRLLAVCLLCLAFALPGFAQRKTTPRPHYGGGHHTESHGGAYPGGQGRSHKGGHYRNSRTANRYGTHK